MPQSLCLLIRLPLLVFMAKAALLFIATFLNAMAGKEGLASWLTCSSLKT